MNNSEKVPILTDTLTRRLYANDASMYEKLPHGVAFPKTAGDVQKIVDYANSNKLSITARSGGTSLAGQTTGAGIIMDVSKYMTKILRIDPEDRVAEAEPGVIRDSLNRVAARYNLQFGPDTSTTNRCMLGGMIGNNSCGSFSIKHQTTREHVEQMEVVLSDGSKALFKPLSISELKQKRQLESLEGHIYRAMLRLLEQYAERIRVSYPHPEIIRRNTGYALDRLLEMQPYNPDGRKFNLCELLCGSEGTLALTTRAVVNLVPVDPVKLMLIPQFNSLRESMEATIEAVKHDPAAVELADHYILEATKGNIEQRKNRFFLEGDPRALLMIQFEGQSLTELKKRAENLAKKLKTKGLGYAFPILEQQDKIRRVWELRKAGLGLLMGMKQDSQTPSFVEDTAVRVKDLPEYTDKFQHLLDKYNTKCVFYAHVSVGELHLRPIINLRNKEGLQKMKNMARDVASLVKDFGGSLSGEHGDGRARSPYIETVLGSDMMPVLRKVKEIWDPNYRFNPGNIVAPQPIDMDLRYSPKTPELELESQFNWKKEGGLEAAIELCNGAGVCRKLADSGGTMCPSYMATRDEKDSTRGRANVFRQVFFEKGMDAYGDDDVRTALDLCLSCKACKSECPANVDMAKMKAEFMHQWQQRNGISRSAAIFGQPDKMYPLAAKFPGLVNRLSKMSLSKFMAEKIFNIHRERNLPEFAHQTFVDWYCKHNTSTYTGQTSGTVVLLVDIFTNYHEPEVAKSALEVLKRLGYNVIVPECLPTGRPQISKGLLEDARKLMRNNLNKLQRYIQDEIPVVGLEPSEILTLRDEYPDMADENRVEMAQKLAGQTYLLEEFINRHFQQHPATQKIVKPQKTPLVVHGHCHAKALTGMEPLLTCLKQVGYEVTDLQTGCCGMAGSFGYEKKHYEVSMQIGELLLFPALRNKLEEAMVCAPGFSCRHQIMDGVSQASHHPAVFLQNALC